MACLDCNEYYYSHDTNCHNKSNEICLLWQWCSVILSFGFWVQYLKASVFRMDISSCLHTQQWQIHDFPNGRRVPTLEFGTKTYYLVSILLKLHENEKNWTERGPSSLGTHPPDSPMHSWRGHKTAAISVPLMDHPDWRIHGMISSELRISLIWTKSVFHIDVSNENPSYVFFV